MNATAEIMVLELNDGDFTRETDNTFGYKELFIKPKKSQRKYEARRTMA